MRIRAVSLVVAVVVFGLALVGGIPSAQAASLTWDGGAGSSSWSAATNWNPNQVPASGDDLVFSGAATDTSPDLCNLGSPVFSLSSVTFASSGHNVQDNCVVQNVDLVNQAGTNTYGTKICGTVEVVNNGTQLNVPGTLQSACGTAILASGSGSTSFTGTWNMNPSVTLTGPGLLTIASPTQFRAVSVADVQGGTLEASTPVLNLQVKAGGTFSPTCCYAGNAPWTQVQTGDVASGGTLRFDLFAPGLQEEVVVNGGAFDIDGATLSAIPGGAFAQNAAPGDVMTLIQTINGGTRTGTFAGLPEGSIIPLGGLQWRLSYVAGASQQEVTLTALETISIGDPAAAVVEGDTGTTTTMTFPVTLSNPVSGDVTVTAATNDGLGSATSGSDHQSATASVTIPAGQTAGSFDVTVIGDDVDEPDVETVLATISNLNGPGAAEVALGDTSATGQIQDDEGPPTISVADGSVTEGDGAGSTDLVLVVTLSNESSQDVTVDFDTGGIAGEAQVGADYTGTNGKLTFAPGDTSEEIRVPVLHDDVGEDDEVFAVSLYTPTGGTLADDAATGTIVDDDPVTASIGDGTVTPEGDAGPSPIAVDVTLSGPYESDVTFSYTSTDATAVAGQDYVAGNGTATITGGATSTSIPTSGLGDLLDEPDETYTLTISNPSVPVTIGDGTSTVTIVDDDDPPTMSIADATVDPEGDAGTTDASFVVSLDAPSAQTVTATVTVTGATAAAGSDFDVPSGTTVTFAPGVTSVPFAVPVRGDTLDEEDETFIVALSAPANATLDDDEATGAIVDDDDPPTLSVLDAAVDESGSASVEVHLSAPSGKEVTVHAGTANGTATNAPDYVTTAGTLVFAPGETTATLVVPIGSDGDDEPDETFTVTLTDPVNATIAKATATITITDDDLPPTTTTSTTLAPGVVAGSGVAAGAGSGSSGTSGSIVRTGADDDGTAATGVALLLAGLVYLAHGRRFARR